MEQIRYNVSRPQRLLLFVCITLVCFLAGAVMVYFIGSTTTPRVRIGTVVQDVVCFAMPAIATAVLVTRRPADLLLIRRPQAAVAVLMLATVIFAVPAMNALVEWNASLPLPDAWRARSEMQQEAVMLLFGGSGPGSLVAAVLIVGLMAPLTEELLFRGCLQRLLGGMINRHAAVWIAAAVFSLAHFDMSGFIPRMLLGACFGYGMLWSGSLWTAVACHALNNCMAVTAMWLEAGGNAAGESMQTFGAGSVSLIVASVIICAALLRRAWTARDKAIA